MLVQAAFQDLEGLPLVGLIWPMESARCYDPNRLMPSIDPDSSMAVQQELTAGESVLKEGSGSYGTLRFAQTAPMWSRNSGWGAWDGMVIGGVPIFMDIEGVDSVYRLMSDLRDTTEARSPRP